ncbi:hypothetical protein [Actinomadura rupiterrae]|uniref:hypothetical protein n=1 Tax=Actinomadura rupiterrae TaxID=559627 RepID=UPI0020A2FB56|nr:hypothetical protein [Actinomadura rupiterrae]MCP2337104.1 hypothetical protein [Actinomadura rupiterrae]
MADVTETENKGVAERLDAVMLNVARARIAVGVAAFAAPRLTVKAMGLGGHADAGRDYVTRMFAARELALGAGYLLSRGPARKTWARLGLVVDGLDTVNGLRSRPGLPLWVAAGATGIAAGATALGAAKVTRDLLP